MNSINLRPFYQLKRLIIYTKYEKAFPSLEALHYDLAHTQDDYSKTNEIITKTPEMFELCWKAVNSIREGNIKTAYSKSLFFSGKEIQKETFLESFELEEIEVDTLSYRDWLESIDINPPKKLYDAFLSLEKDFNEYTYRNFEASYDYLDQKFKLNAWNIEEAILYIHGYEASSNHDINHSIVRNNYIDMLMEIVNSYKYDKKLSDKLIKGLRGEEDQKYYDFKYSIKPSDFIEWAKNKKYLHKTWDYIDLEKRLGRPRRIAPIEYLQIAKQLIDADELILEFKNNKIKHKTKICKQTVGELIKQKPELSEKSINLETVCTTFRRYKLWDEIEKHSKNRTNN